MPQLTPHRSFPFIFPLDIHNLSHVQISGKMPHMSSMGRKTSTSKYLPGLAEVSRPILDRRRRQVEDGRWQVAGGPFVL